MQIESITVMILTYNESANIERTLSRLASFKSVLIVDSFSNDETLAIASKFANVELIQRKFDNFAEQCNFGLKNIQTEWTLSMDADYGVTDELIKELQSLEPDFDSYFIRFRYCIHGERLRGTLYPPRRVLYRTELAKYHRDGHAHHVAVAGLSGTLLSALDHDDRKNLSVWIGSQQKYAVAEADKLLAADAKLEWKDKLRSRIWIAPFLVLLYCLFRKGLIFDGKAGLYYTYQRVIAELLLGLELMERDLAEKAKHQAPTQY